MNDLSLTQEYLLCVLGNKGKVSSFSIEKGMCLAAAGLLELLMDRVVRLDNEKLSVEKALPEEKKYLRSIFYFIDQKQPVNFKKVVEYYTITFTDKNINELIDDVGSSLAVCGCAKEEKGGLFGGKTHYIPDKEAMDGVIQNIRAELLEDGEISEDIVALAALLDKSGQIKKYFSAYEKDDLKKRLKEIKDNPQNEMIKAVSDYIETLFVMLVVAAT